MNPKWLIETSSLPEDITPLFEALNKQGIIYQEITQDFGDSDDHEFTEGCVIFMGSLRLAKKLRRKAKWIPGVYYNVEAFNCDHYYPYFGDLLLNRDYIILPFGEMKRQKEFLYETLGEDRAIFIRPNRGDKPFTGKLVYKEKFEEELGYLGFGQMESYELIVAAKPINILQEWRFVCVQGKIITGSTYKKNNIASYEEGYSEDAGKTAIQAAGMYNPDPVWIIDVGLTQAGRYCIVEVGCFSCAGLYKCDRKIIVEEVSRVALEEWKEYQ